MVDIEVNVFWAFYREAGAAAAGSLWFKGMVEGTGAGESGAGAATGAATGAAGATTGVASAGTGDTAAETGAAAWETGGEEIGVWLCSW